jgi:hypothetical protein
MAESAATQGFLGDVAGVAGRYAGEASADKYLDRLFPEDKAAGAGLTPEQLRRLMAYNAKLGGWFATRGMLPWF